MWLLHFKYWNNFLSIVYASGYCVSYTSRIIGLTHSLLFIRFLDLTDWTLDHLSLFYGWTLSFHAHLSLTISFYVSIFTLFDFTEQVTRWIISHEWTVGELWNMMGEYGSKRLKGETRVGFFSWLLPLVDSNDAWAVGHQLNLHEI